MYISYAINNATRCLRSKVSRHTLPRGTSACSVPPSPRCRSVTAAGAARATKTRLHVVNERVQLGRGYIVLLRSGSLRATLAASSQFTFDGGWLRTAQKSIKAKTLVVFVLGFVPPIHSLTSGKKSGKEALLTVSDCEWRVGH